MWQYTPYTVPLAAATALGAVVAYFVWHRGQSEAETWGTAVQIGLVLWAGTHLLTVSSATLGGKLAWFLLFPPTIAWLVVTLFGFSLHYTGRGEWLTRSRFAVLVAFPLLVLATSATNAGGLAPITLGHELVLIDPELDTSRGFAVLVYDWGPAFYVFTAVEYALTAVYGGMLLQKALRTRNVYRRISFVLFASVVVLAAATVVSLFASPFPHFMLLPFTYLLVGIVHLLTTVSKAFVRTLPVDRLLTPVDSRYADVSALARDLILEEIDNGIVVMDREGIVVDINGTAKKMIGAERSVGSHVLETATVERIKDAGAFETLIEGEGELGEFQSEVWVDSPTGKRCYDVSMSELTDSGDVVTGYVMLLHDVTDQKHREDALVEREHELERQKERLQARTNQLEHQNERLDRFAGIVSHDLRNPLNVAQGHLTLVTDDLDRTDGDTVEVDAGTVEAIDESHDRMAAIIDDALTLARQGKAITETEAVPLASAAETAWRTVETPAAELVVDTDRDVAADRDRLLTLFENLFRNAVEHGGEAVTIRVGDVGDAGFFVADDGPGIPDDRKDEVLEHGYTTNSEGTGFGLTIVDDVASAHGWELEVREAEKGGARFELTGVDRYRTVT